MPESINGGRMLGQGPRHRGPDLQEWHIGSSGFVGVFAALCLTVWTEGDSHHAGHCPSPTELTPHCMSLLLKST